MEEVAIKPTIELPELTQDWETASWRIQIETCVHQDPGESITDSMDMGLSKLRESKMDREAGHASPWSCKESDRTERLN